MKAFTGLILFQVYQTLKVLEFKLYAIKFSIKLQGTSLKYNFYTSRHK